jgi:hypothetical protein
MKCYEEIRNILLEAEGAEVRPKTESSRASNIAKSS